jgi:hypothetical protein
MNVHGIYKGLSALELEKIKTQILQGLEKTRTGTQFVEVDMGGNLGKKLLLSYNELVHELREVNIALKQVLPEIYGKAIKRIIPNFNKALVKMSCRINVGIVNYMPEDEYIEAGATAYDPVEGNIPAQRITTPDMTKIGKQELVYEAQNTTGQKVTAVRSINIVSTIHAEGLSQIYGHVVNDDSFSYNRHYSTITNTKGYWFDADYQTQIAKDLNGKWKVYDYSGLIHDTQQTINTSPLSVHGEWGIIKVTNEYIR